MRKPVKGGVADIRLMGREEMSKWFRVRGDSRLSSRRRHVPDGIEQDRSCSVGRLR